MPSFTNVLDETEIARRVQELGKEIAAHYAGQRLVAVCVLKGACVFFADLVRAMQGAQLDLTLDFVRLASYGHRTESSGKVEFMKDLETSVEDCHVLVVEDIVDTGNSMDYLLKVLALRNPRSVRICSLIDKKERRTVDLDVDFVGFTLQDGFIVGYGLDYNERYRELAGIYELHLDDS